MDNYFDYAAASPMSPAARAAMEPYFTDKFYNPSALYLAAKDVHAAVEQSRATVAVCLGIRPSEIIFTAGGTEANNLAIHGVMSQYPEANCVVSAIEHDSVLEPSAQYNNKIVPVSSDGTIDTLKLAALIDDNTVLISCMYANNEIGTIQFLGNISKIVDQKRHERMQSGNTLPLLLHTDASQAPNYLHVLCNTLGVDMMTLNGGKIYGPKQSGVLYVKNNIKLQPIIRGGGQERTMRSGTENVVGIIGFAAALQEATQIRVQETLRLQTLQDEIYTFIELNLPTVSINGTTKHRIANNVHLTIPGTDNERVMMQLDERGFQVAVGSACSASSDEPSHVLKAIGLDDAAAQSSIRITMGRHTSYDSVTQLMNALKTIVTKSINS